MFSYKLITSFIAVCCWVHLFRLVICSKLSSEPHTVLKKDVSGPFLKHSSVTCPAYDFLEFEKWFFTQFDVILNCQKKKSYVFLNAVRPMEDDVFAFLGKFWEYNLCFGNSICSGLNIILICLSLIHPFAYDGRLLYYYVMLVLTIYVLVLLQ